MRGRRDRSLILILLLALAPSSAAAQTHDAPFRIDGDRAYGLGIADDVRFETVFQPMPFRPASLPLAEHVQRLYAEAGGTAKINRVSLCAGTDAAFAAPMDIAAGRAGVAIPAESNVGKVELAGTQGFEPQ
ncbi:MAG: hypothetical protein M3R55_00400 [Acidobacteriota bacterium]|nr:hypothetical protein [Acidobacteriota bacterium]